MTIAPIDLSRLTPREREVYRLTLEGISNAAVGQRLKISTRTVEGHLLRVRRVLGLQRIVSPTLRPRTAQARPSPIKAPDLSVLSARQRQVYDLVVGEGMTSAAAAARLKVSTGTVESHRTRIAARLAGYRQHPTLKPRRAGRVAQHADSLVLVTDLRGVPGSILKAARTALGWTIQRAAAKTGISSVTLSKIEAGKSRATVGPADEPILSAYLRAGATIHRGDDAFWLAVRRR